MSNVDRQAPAANAPAFNWPIDQYGYPMVLCTMQASELIGLKNFSNVMVGPASITMFVSFNDPNGLSDVAKTNIAAHMNGMAEIVEGHVIAVQRGAILESVGTALHGAGQPQG